MTRSNRSWIFALVMPMAMTAGLAQAGDMAEDGKMMNDATMMDESHGMSEHAMDTGGMAQEKMADDMAGNMGHGMEGSMGNTMEEPMMEDKSMMDGKTMDESDGMH